MSIVIGTLRIDLEAGTASFSEAMEKMEHLSAKTANDVKRSLEKIAAAGVLVGTAIAAGTAELIKSSVEAIVGLEHMSEAAGTTIDHLSELSYAAQRVGVPTEQLVKGMEKLAKAAYAAQNGNHELAAIFKRLGVDVSDSHGHLKDTGVLMDELAPKFAAMADGSGKTALAQKLFSRSGADLIPFLNEWGAHMDELREKARAFGIVLGPEVGANVKQFEKKIKDLGAAWTGFKWQLTSAALPALNAFADKLQEVARRADIPQLAKTFGNTLGDALRQVVSLMDFVIQHANTLKHVLEGLLALKVVNFAIPLIGQIAKGGAGNIGEGIEKLTIGMLGLKNVLPVLGNVWKSIRGISDTIRLLYWEEGIASAATYAFSGALTVLEKHPVIIALTAIAAGMYALRNATFTAGEQVYEFVDAYRALWQILTFQNKSGESTWSQVLARVRADRLEAESLPPGMYWGMSEPRRRFGDKKLVPDTRMGEKDPYGEEIKRLEEAIRSHEAYGRALGTTREKIIAVAAAHEAESIILKLNKELTESGKFKDRALKTDQENAIRGLTLKEESRKAIDAYNRSLEEQNDSTGLAIVQGQNLAAAELQGEEAVRQATLANAQLAVSYGIVQSAVDIATQKNIAWRKELLADEAETQRSVAANKKFKSLQDELDVRNILNAAIIQGMDAQREAELRAATFNIDQRLKNPALSEAGRKDLQDEKDAVVALANAKFEAADLERARGLLSPLEVYVNEITGIEKATTALRNKQTGMLSYGQQANIAAEAQDAFNKATDQTVNLLLREESLGAGVKAFFLDMQKSAITTSQIIYGTLHDAFSKVTDNLTELVTGGKTNFGKMFQDIGKQMVHGVIAQQLQKGIGAIGKAMGIDLAGSKPDGTKNNPIWVQMAGMAGLNLGGYESAPIIPGTGPFPEIGGGFGGILSKLGGLFGHVGGGIFSFLAGLIPHAAGGMVSPDSAYLVGENGPEILMGASGQIASNSSSQRMLSGGGATHYYNIDARGTDPVLTEQRTRAAIMAAHNSAVANSQLVSDEQLKRTPSPHRY